MLFKNLFNKYRSIISYGFFGVLTTIINTLVFYLLSDVCGIQYLISNASAWCAGVCFAFFTNKIFVFQKKSENRLSAVREFISFVGCRVLTGALDMGLMYIMISIYYIDKNISKISVNVIVIILNYIFGKFVVFKK